MHKKSLKDVSVEQNKEISCGQGKRAKHDGLPLRKTFKRPQILKSIASPPITQTFRTAIKILFFMLLRSHVLIFSIKKAPLAIFMGCEFYGIT